MHLIDLSLTSHYQYLFLSVKSSPICITYILNTYTITLDTSTQP